MGKLILEAGASGGKLGGTVDNKATTNVNGGSVIMEAGMSGGVVQNKKIIFEAQKPLFEAAGALGVDIADLFMPKLPSVFDQVKQNPNMPRELPKQRTSEEINQEIVNRINNKLKEDEAYHQEIINFDAVAAEREIAELEAALEKADDRIYLGNTGMQKILKYKNKQDIKDEIAEKKIALNQKKRLQELLKNNDTAVNDPEFAKYVKSGKETSWQDVRKVVGASGGSVPRDLYDDLGAAAWALYKRNNPGAQIPLYTDLRNAEIFLEQMKDEEFDLLAYYIGKDKETGGNQAETYVELMKETLQNRKGQEIYEQYLKDNTVLEVLYGVPAGLDQFTNGVTSLFNFKDDYIPASPVQVAGSLAREDLADDSIPLWYNFNDGKWENKIFGASLGQMAYDSVQTTANMAPSIAASTLIGLINPTAGAVTGGVLMGGSAAGNAYQEALNNGWGKAEARTYSTLIGASEALLSATISKVFGGKLVSEAVENAIKGVTNGFARFALNYGAAFVSEGFEEAAQEVLSPLFENIAFGYNRKGFEDIDWGEVAYSFLLGGLSGGMFETAGSGVKRISSVASVMKEYNTAGKTQNLLKLALSFPAESKANKLATKYNDQVKSNGKLSANKVYNLVAATENVVTERLTKLGETQNVPAIASAAVKAVTTGQLTTKEKAVLQSSQHGAELLNEINVTEETETPVLQSTANVENEQPTGVSGDISGTNGIKLGTSDTISGASGTNDGVSGNVFGASGQDSGVRHHTSKAEQEYIQRICDALGVKMQFVHITSKLMAKYGYNISEDSLPDGFYDKDSQTLYIGFTGYDPVKFVFKHELTHFGEGTESYKNFVDAVNESKAFKEWLVKQYGKDAKNLSTAALEGKVIQQYVDRRKAYEPNFKPEDAKAEMVADFVGRCLFDNDTVALERMLSGLNYEQAETVWQHIKEFFAYLKRKLSGEKDLVWEITRLENQFNRMLSEAVQTKKSTEQSGGIKFDIKKSTDGNKYVQVDGGKIETESANDIAKILSNIVRNKFNDFIDVSGQKIGINGKTAREWQRSKDAQYLLANEKQKFADKLSAFENADELLKSARDYIGEEIKHIRKDNFKEFARGVVDFKVDDRGYSADIIVGTTKTNVAILYDIVHLQEKKIEDASHTTQGRRAETSSNDIILNEESSVKNNIPENEANNSDSGLKFTFSRALNNEKIQKAEAMEKELEDEYDKGYREMLIWEETGLIRDPSGVWVYEIDDGKMRFYPKGDRFKKRKMPRGKNLLKNYIRHKELFERYPQLNDTELVVYDFKEPGTKGAYLPEFNCVMLDKAFAETASVEEAAETIIHEIQHAAQHFDERENGANIEYWNQRLKLGTMPKNPKTGREYTPVEAYYATRGEYEARMSSERLWMDSDEKNGIFGTPFYNPKNTVSTNAELVGAKPSSLKFSVPTDREYLKSVENGDNKALQQMVDNKAKAEGYTERLYHQTDADFTEFNTDNQKAGKYDWELPTGMFLKPSNDDIGLKGKKQMDLYAKQRNPLKFRDRAEAQQYWRDNVDGYDEAADKILSIDAEYQNKLEAAAQNTRNYLKKWRRDNPEVDSREIYSDTEYQRLNDLEDSIVDEWEAESDKASLAAKKLIDDYIAQSDYDGVVIERDIGAMGRSTKTYIVFDSSQLKDASPVTYDDSGKVIPLSERFNGDKKDIRFSIPNVLSAEEMLEAYEKGEISRQDYLNSLSNNMTLNPVEISDLTKEDANTTPKLKRKTGVSDGNKVSKFYGSVLESDIFDLDFKAEIMTDTFVEKYKSVTNKETLQRAADELDTGGRAYVNRWWTIDPAHASLIDTAVGLILMDRYQRVGDYDSAAAVTEKVREFGTAGGQQIQLFSILGRLSPETMALYAQRELDKAFEILAKDKAQKWINQNQEKFKLSEEDIKFIREYTVLAALFDENTRQKAVLLGEISARVQNKMPPQKGDSIRAFQRNAMLLNPKTQIRNIVGNGGMVPVFIASDIIGSGIDKMLAKKTGIRTTGNFNVKSLKGVKKGLYESYDDFKLGIRTKQEELNRFDVNVKHGGKSFNDNSNGLFGTGTLKKQLNAVARGLNKIDNFTSFCLEAGDRPFFEMWYMNSLNTQMKLNNVDIPTTEMMEVARQEALQRTWQDDNTFTKSVSNLKRILNNLIHLPNSNYGLGDFVLKFVKTPSNLAKAIIEFSPAGLVSTWSNAKKLKNAIETNRFTPQLQKEYVRSLSNAITGTLIYTIIGIGAALGLVKLSGDGEDDKDASNFEKYIMGIPPYSIEFFGVPIAYDWMQPFGSILATVAEFMENRETNSELDIGDAVWEAVCAGGKTFTQQSFLQSMYEFFSGDDIIDGLVNIALAEPAAFVPQAFSQVASFTDKYRRTSYDSNSNFQTAINKIIAKIPVLRTTLPKQVNSLGEDVKNPQYFKEALGAWNAFASPWNTYPKSSKEVVGEIYKLYKDSGETSVMPRMAPNYFERSGVRINLTPEEKANFQRSMGDRSVQMLVQLFNSKEYTNLTDQQKVDIVSKIYSYSYARAKSEYDYDFETLSAILGKNEDGEPILTKERYDRMSDENKKKVIEELFLSKTEIKYLDDYKKLVDYYIRKAED